MGLWHKTLEDAITNLKKSQPDIKRAQEIIEDHIGQMPALNRQIVALQNHCGGFRERLDLINRSIKSNNAQQAIQKINETIEHIRQIECIVADLMKKVKREG